MKKKVKLSRKLVIIIDVLLVVLFFASCTNHVSECTIVKEIKLNKIGDEKYRVTLDFYMIDQILYTDSVYNVGDTLYFSKKY